MSYSFDRWGYQQRGTVTSLELNTAARDVPA